MRCYLPEVRLVSSLSDFGAVLNYTSDTCKDAVCTGAIVGEIVEAVEAATAACTGVVGVLDFALTKQIADIIIVSSLVLL